jgi:hypothetical protein
MTSSIQRLVASVICSGLFWSLCGAALDPSRVRAEASEACVSAYENAQVLRLRGRYVAARQQLLTCVQSSCPELLQNDCVNWLAEVDASLPTVVFSVVDAHGNDIAGARVYAGGAPLEGWVRGRALALDPGSYELRFEAPGYRAEQQTLTVNEAEKNRMVRARLTPIGDEAAVEDDQQEHAAPAVTSGPAEPSEAGESGIPLATYVLGGASIAGLGAFTYFAVSGKSEYDELERSCGRSCPESRTEAGRRAYILADVALGVSVVSAAAALWVYLAHDSDGEEQRAPVQVGVSTRGVALSGRF